MRLKDKKKYVFKKGERYHLDQVYSILGQMNVEDYEQKDIADYDRENRESINSGLPQENDGGEYIRIINDFTIWITISRKQ